MNRENIQLIAKITASDTEALYEVARTRGIQMPHPALGIFKSVLCEVEKTNANGIRLGAKATNEAVSTLVGTQINRNHLRTDNVLGHTIDAVINKDNEIEIVCIFFKDIYEEEWNDAQNLFKKGELTMSFELSADVESQDKLADGTKRLNDYYFTGAGLLFGVKPACKKARVFEIATRKLSDKLLMERQSLIFANNQNSQKSIMEVLKLMADEVKKIEEVQVAEPVVAEAPVVTPEAVVVEEAKKVCGKCGEPMESDTCAKCKTAEMLCPECQEPMENDECAKCKKAAVVEPVVEAAVEPIVEAKVEEVIAQPAEQVEPAPLEPCTTVREETMKVTDTVDPVANTETVKVETTSSVTVDDVKVVEQVQVTETVYTFAQVEEIKAEYEKQIAVLKEQITAKEKELEVVKIEAAKREEVAAEEKPVLSTGHKAVYASSDSCSAIAKILKRKKR